MQTSPKPLPKNPRVLELLLTQVNRDLTFLEPIVATQKFRVQELEPVFQNPYTLLPRIELLQSTTRDLNKHMALGGPDADVMAGYLDGSALNEIRRKRQPAQALLSSIATARPEGIDRWKPAVAALAEIAEADAAVVGQLKQLRRKIIAALEAETGADREADNRGEGARRARIRLPENPEVFKLAKAINDSSDTEQSQAQIAIQFTNGDEKKASNLLRQLRRFPHLVH